MTFQGKTAVVTGGGGGIGSATCLSFAEAGVNLMINEHDSTRAELIREKVEALGVSVEVHISDAADPSSAEEAVSSTIARFGRIDILVNNVGIGPHTPFEKLEKDEWERVIGVNLTSYYLFSRAVLNHMKENHSGVIVNIASAAGRKYRPMDGAHYTTSKSGILGLTRHLAKEYASFGVRINSISPGFVETNLVSQYLNTEKKDLLVKKIPMGRFAIPSEIARVVLFLCSDDASYITGANIDVNGGMVML